MNCIIVGLDFRTAPIELREKLAVANSDLGYIASDLNRALNLNEAVVVSTCNRTEYYLSFGQNFNVGQNLHGYSDLHALKTWLAVNYGVNLDDLHRYTYNYRDQDAVRHLMSLAAGLKSMVLGEAEILGQLKQSYYQAHQHKCVAKFFSRLFEMSFAAAKRVRLNTAIGVNPVSIAYIAVKLAAELCSGNIDNLQHTTALIIGAGSTAKLILTHLLGLAVSNIIIANRTIARAEELVASYTNKPHSSPNIHDIHNIKLITLQELPAIFYKADIVITSTASPLPIIGKGMVEKALKLRNGKPICIIDVAMPRDVEPEVGLVPNVHLYSIDALEQIVRENQQIRLSAIEKATLLVEEEVALFMRWWQTQVFVPKVCKLRSAFYKERDCLLELGYKELDRGKDPYLVLNKIATLLTNKFLHNPTIGIKNAANGMQENSKQDSSNNEVIKNFETVFNLES